MAIDLHHLRLALRFICPTTDWSWLLTITKRIATTARRSRKYHLVTSERLYALGLALMDTAIMQMVPKEHPSRLPSSIATG
jgi:hypothetical protein